VNSYANYVTTKKLLVKQLCRGWQMRELATFSDMSVVIRKAGFRHLVVQNQAKAVRPTLRSINRLVTLLKPLFLMTKSLKWQFFLSIADNVQALGTVAEMDHLGIVGYYSHIAQK
jgi:hypothetical protein